MYGIFTYIYPINEPNVGKYTIHGASGIVYLCVCVGNADKKNDLKNIWQHLVYT